MALPAHDSFSVRGAPADPLARVDSLRDPETVTAARRVPQQMSSNRRVAAGDSLTSIMWDAYQYGVSLAAPTLTGSRFPPLLPTPRLLSFAVWFACITSHLLCSSCVVRTFTLPFVFTYWYMSCVVVVVVVVASPQ